MFESTRLRDEWLMMASGVITAVILFGQFTNAVNVVDDAVYFDNNESLRVVSQSGLESWINYGFNKINSTTWNVTWSWRLSDILTNITLYLSTREERYLPFGSTAFEVLNSNVTPALNLTNRVRVAISQLNQRRLRGYFYVDFPSGFKDGERFKVGFNSTVIESSAGASALFNERSRKLVDLDFCNAYAIAYRNSTQAAVKISNDSGATWTTFNVSNGGTDYLPSITKLSNHDLWVVMLDSLQNVYAVNISYDGSGCSWTKNAAVNITNAYDASSTYGGVNLNLISCPDDSLHLFYDQAAPSTPHLDHKVCRAASVDCSVAANWNAMNNSVGWDDYTGYSRADMVAACDASNNFYAITDDKNTGKAHFYKWENTGAGLWRLQYFQNNGYNSGGEETGNAGSLILNSTGTIFYVFQNRTNTATNYSIWFTHCENSAGQNCSTNLNWRMTNGTTGAEIISAPTNPAQSSYRPSATLFNDTAYVFYDYNDTNQSDYSSSLAFIYLNSTAQAWTTQTTLLSGSTQNNYSSTWFEANSANKIGFAFLNYTGASTYRILFDEYYTLATSIYHPANTSYLGNAINLSYYYVSPFYATANCSTFLDGAWISDAIVNNNTITNYTASALSYTQHYFFASCKNASDTSSSGVNFSMYTSTVGLKVFCYDEQTSTQLTCDYNVYNSTNTTVQTGWYYNSSVPTGILTAEVSKSDYYNRTYYINLTTSNETINAFLLNTSNPATIFVRFHIQTIAYAPIANALVHITKGGGTVGDQYTDGFGIASFYLDSNTNYVVSASHPTYGSNSLTVKPAQNDYTIILGGGAGGNGTGGIFVASPYCFDNVSVWSYPSAANLFRGTQNVSWGITSHDSKLVFYGWYFYINGTLVQYVNLTSGTGGVLYQTLQYDLANASGNASYTSFWGIANYSGACADYGFFTVYNITGNTGLVGALTSFKSDTGLSNSALGLIALFFVMIATAWAAKYTVAGGAIIGLLTAAFFTYTQWITPMSFALLFLGGVAISYFALRRGY